MGVVCIDGNLLPPEASRRNWSRRDEIRLSPNFVVQGRDDTIVTAMLPCSIVDGKDLISKGLAQPA